MVFVEIDIGRKISFCHEIHFDISTSCETTELEHRENSTLCIFDVIWVMEMYPESCCTPLDRVSDWSDFVLKGSDLKALSPVPPHRSLQQTYESYGIFCSTVIHPAPPPTSKKSMWQSWTILATWQQLRKK